MSFKEIPQLTYQQALRQLPQQLAMQDRFGIYIAFKNITQKNLSVPSPVYIFCQSVNMPQTSILNKQMRWDEGPMMQRPQGIDYGGEGIAMDFILDSEMIIKDFFESWAAVAFDARDNTVRFPVAYLHDIYIFNTDSTDNPRHIVRLEDAFPRNMSMVSFNQGAHNTPASITVTFAFHRMHTGRGEDYDTILKRDWTPGGVQQMAEGEFPGQQINNEFYRGGWDPADPDINNHDRTILGKAISFFSSLNPTVFNIATKIPTISTL